MKKVLIKVGIILFTALVLFYCFLPSLNIHDATFYFFVLILLIEWLLLEIPDSIKLLKDKGFKYVLKSSLASNIVKVIFGLIVASILYVFVTSFVFSPVFMARTYANRIQVKDVDFSTVPPFNFNTTAIIDRDSAEKLGDKVMGEMTDLVSQFRVSNEYSQISYKEGTYRVTPLAYDGFVKYVRNLSNHIPGYIIVNTTSGETKLNRLEKGMRYVPSAYFFDNLYRKLRFDYPFDIFGDPTFEIDEEGNPYYVCTTYTYRGISSLKKVIGVILFNPIDGTSQKYEIKDAPNWVDRIYPEDLINTELNDYGKYRNGYLNSFIGQEGVIQTSEGYNYISKDGDIWLYTGMTSAMSDSSNVGFVLVDLRTHEAQYIATSGADEYSVMDSAEGEVLNFGYKATFPVLVNIGNKPVYILSLKDSAGLVKMYAMVDAQDYQQVYTCKADKDARTAINQLIQEMTGQKTIASDEDKVATITIDSIKDAVIDGNSYIYIKANNDIYELELNELIAPKALFLEEGQQIKISYYQEGSRKYITDIK